MSYTLLFLGPPRTATRSLWVGLSNHKQISACSPKEPLNRKGNDLAYFENYSINKDTKVLVDSTPAAYSLYQGRIKFILKRFPKIDNLKIIYPIRKPHDRLYSNVKQILVSRFYGRSDWCQFTDAKLRIDRYELMNFIDTFFLDSFHIERARELTEDIFFVRWDKLWDSVPEILDFINLDPQYIGIPNSNSFVNFFKSEIFDGSREDLKEIFKLGTPTRKGMNKIFKNDLITTQKITGINLKDWIKEIENEDHSDT